MTTQTSPDAPVAPPRTVTARRELRVEHLTKRFGGVTAVNDVSFAVAAGEAVAVIGPNGAGKSTLLKLLSGGYRPDEGSVRFGELVVSDLAPHAVARHGIGLAHQIPRPFTGLTVRENIAVGAMAQSAGHRSRPGARHAWVEHVLETCGLVHVASTPAGALRLLDLKRLELARALSLDPALILLDEVAAGLNGRDLDAVIELIRALHQQGRSVILVEHVEGVVASLVDRVLVIDWGRLIAEGSPVEISSDARVREVYLGGGSSPAQVAPVRQAPAPGAGAVLLSAASLTTSYGDIVALRDVDLVVGRAEIVAVLGANGAGKSTLAGTLSGLVRPRSGHIVLDGTDVTREPAFERNRRGIAHCPEGRRIFGELTVRDNLLLAGPVRLARADVQRRMEAAHEIFPVLSDLSAQRAGTLSGGQQQMLAIGRALMSRPRLLICDEISLGLAPVAIDALYEALRTIRARGVAVVLIEQNVHRSLGIADRVYVLNRGVVTYHGDAAPLADDALLDHLYFATADRAVQHASATLPNEGNPA